MNTGVQLLMELNEVYLMNMPNTEYNVKLNVPCLNLSVTYDYMPLIWYISGISDKTFKQDWSEHQPDSNQFNTSLENEMGYSTKISCTLFDQRN